MIGFRACWAGLGLALSWAVVAEAGSMITLLDPSLPIPQVLTRDGQTWAGYRTGDYGLGGRYRQGTVTTIDYPPGFNTDNMTGISDDGEVVTGDLYLDSFVAFRWEAGVLQPLLGPGDEWSFSGLGSSVSANGSVVVGSVGNGGIGLPVFWQGGIRTFLPLPAGDTGGWADGVSADGRTIVGSSYGPDGNHAVVWRDGVVSILPDLPGQAGYPSAMTVSDDGTTIVGAVDTATSYYFVRWVNGNLQLLLNEPVNGFGADGFDVSADGSLAIFNDGRSLIWRDGLGTKTFEDYIEYHYGLSVDAVAPNRIYFGASKMSADGRYFSGLTYDANYSMQSFIVSLDPADFVIPEPSTISLAGLAALGLLWARRVGAIGRAAGARRPGRPSPGPSRQVKT
jgi:hypothetical protein